MEKELISVIIPVFNLEKYLKKCINSVLEQTYECIEVIIINDGSTDKSLEICQNFANKDQRIKVITQNNKGVSSARNKGIDNANGKYILFIDGDDYIEKTMIEKLYLNIKGYDISICNFNKIDNDIKIKNYITETKVNLNSKEFLISIFEDDGVRGFLWNKLIRRDIINGTRFDEELSVMEDLIFLATISKNINKVFIDKELYLYNYINRKGSALNSLNIEKYKKIILAYEKILNILEGQENIKAKYLCDYIRNLMELNYNLKKNKENKGIYEQKIKEAKKKYLKTALKTTYYSSKDKFKLLIMIKFSLLYFKLKEIRFKIQ